MSTPRRPTAHEPSHTPPLDGLRPIQPELTDATDAILPTPVDVPGLPVPGPEEEPI
jgi:hypothetical protein